MFVSVTLSCCFVCLSTYTCQLLVLVTAQISHATEWDRVGGNKLQPKHPGQKSGGQTTLLLCPPCSSCPWTSRQDTQHRSPKVITPTDTSHLHHQYARLQRSLAERCDLLQWSGIRRSEDICPRSIGFEDPLQSVLWALFVRVEGNLSTLSETYLLPSMVHLAVKDCVS